MLKKYNMGQDVLTFVWEIFSKAVDANKFEELRTNLSNCICMGLYQSMLGSYAKREKVFLSYNTTLA